DVDDEEAAERGELPPAQRSPARVLIASEEQDDGANPERLERDVAGRPERQERKEVVRQPEPAEGTRHAQNQGRRDDDNEENEDQTHRKSEPRAGRRPPAREEPGEMRPALIVAMRPAGALTKPGTQRPHALLLDPGRPAEANAPTTPRQRQREIEVLR